MYFENICLDNQKYTQMLKYCRCDASVNYQSRYSFITRLCVLHNRTGSYKCLLSFKKTNFNNDIFQCLNPLLKRTCLC